MAAADVFHGLRSSDESLSIAASGTRSPSSRCRSRCRSISRRAGATKSPCPYRREQPTQRSAPPLLSRTATSESGPSSSRIGGRVVTRVRCLALHQGAWASGRRTLVETFSFKCAPRENVHVDEHVHELVAPARAPDPDGFLGMTSLCSAPRAVRPSGPRWRIGVTSTRAAAKPAAPASAKRCLWHAAFAHSWRGERSTSAVDALPRLRGIARQRASSTLI
jgi:hypothetical protein